MDYGANINFDVNATIKKVLNTYFAIDHAERLREKVQKTNKIIYLGDNAREIVFNRLLADVKFCITRKL